MISVATQYISKTEIGGIENRIRTENLEYSDIKQIEEPIYIL